MEFRIRDLTDLVNDLSLSEVNIELEQHRIVVDKITSPVFKKKIQNNIIVLQIRRIELMKQAG